MAKHKANTKKATERKPDGKVKRAKDDTGEGLSRKAYEKEMARLQGELVKVQLWLKQSGAKIIVINTQPSEASGLADIELLGRAGEIVPQLLRPIAALHGSARTSDEC